MNVCGGVVVVLLGAARDLFARRAHATRPRAGKEVIRCNASLSATTPFLGTRSRDSRAARADRDRVARLNELLRTIVGRRDALRVRLLRGCAQAVVDAPLAEKPALRAEVLQLERDTMNQCSALFAVQRCVEGLVRVVSSRNLCPRRRRRRGSSETKLSGSRAMITISKPARACGASPRTPATPRPPTPRSLV